MVQESFLTIPPGEVYALAPMGVKVAVVGIATGVHAAAPRAQFASAVASSFYGAGAPIGAPPGATRVLPDP